MIATVAVPRPWQLPPPNPSPVRYVGGVRTEVPPGHDDLDAVVEVAWSGSDASALEQAYRRRTIAAGTDHLLVQRVVRAPSHCGFYGETREQAFDDLVAWIERGVRPQGDDVLASDLSRIGVKWTPVLDADDPLAPQR